MLIILTYCRSILYTTARYSIDPSFNFKYTIEASELVTTKEVILMNDDQVTPVVNDDEDQVEEGGVQTPTDAPADAPMGDQPAGGQVPTPTPGMSMPGASAPDAGTPMDTPMGEDAPADGGEEEKDEEEEAPAA